MGDMREHGATGEILVSALRRYRSALLILLDVLAIGLAWTLSALLRYSGAVDDLPVIWVVGLACLAAVMHVVCGQLLKFHRGRVAIASVEDTVFLALTTTLMMGVCETINLMHGGAHLGRTVPIAAGAVSLCVMVLARAIWRSATGSVRSAYADDAVPAVIIGAGDAGQQLVRAMRAGNSPYQPVALLDDDRWLQQRRILGVRVLGTVDALARVAKRESASVIIVAVASASGDLLGRIQEQAAEIGVPVKVLPSVAEMLDKPVTIRDIRDINMADILGRKPIDTDIESIAYFLEGKRVLVTGAGGSIGSELCRQINRWNPSALYMLDRDESALHSVQLSIHGHGLLDTEDMVLCDIRDAQAVRAIFDDLRPEVVFHAAALKHLPMLERYPAEAIKTNVLGTLNVLEAARAVDVERFVNISTDKAADPTSVLGLSKRVAERVTADVARHADGSYISVRFGNVLGSRGSVLTAWAAQIAQGGPITVTHPDVMRYFMTVSEACQLVVQAGAIGRDREVLILDMGTPVRLDDVARQLIAQSGQDIRIVYTGLREGEKMSEILIAEAEADARPFHNLITHVDVVPLDRSALATAAVANTRTMARAMLEAWSRREDVPTPAFSPAPLEGFSHAADSVRRALWMIGEGHDAAAPV